MNTSFVSPAGADVFSQRREPLEPIRTKHQAPTGRQ